MDQERRDRILAESRAILDGTWRAEDFPREPQPSPPVELKSDDEIIYTDPRETHASERGMGNGTAPARYATDWQDSDPDLDGMKGWNIWLRDNLLSERHAIIEGIAEHFADMLAKRDRRINQLETKLAELSGQIDAVGKMVGRRRR